MKAYWARKRNNKVEMRKISRKRKETCSATNSGYSIVDKNQNTAGALLKFSDGHFVMFLDGKWYEGKEQ